ncbi:MAG: sensor histidine kinase [Prevotella sp.]|nr:sensor histidine kinase [Prevotella sp.]
MRKKVLILLLSTLFCSAVVSAQEYEKSEWQQRAEAEDARGQIGTARYNFIRAFEDYANKGQMQQSVECGVKATSLYYKRDNYWKEAFELLQRIDQTILSKHLPAAQTAALQYLVAKEKMQMYVKLNKKDKANAQLDIMEAKANASGDEAVKSDMLYNKVVCYYNFGQTTSGDEAFKELAELLTAKQEYGKVEEAYQTLIDIGRRSNSGKLVDKAYKSYIVWKDSTDALKVAAEIDGLKKQIADGKAEIAERDSSLSSRGSVIAILGVLAAILAVVLALGALALMRFILLTRKQKKTINMLNENNALKAKFISNISAQLEPTLRKLDSRQPEVKALQDFSNHIQTLSQLESTPQENMELEEVQISRFFDELMAQVKDKVKSDVKLAVNAPNMSAKIHKEYVSHILLHLLNNAAVYTPEGGKITLDYKKRGAHKQQFLVTNTGEAIPEEKQQDIFKPFLEVKDLTTGDGLGLPICKVMAVKMDGDLSIDPQYTKGTRFQLDLLA